MARGMGAYEAMDARPQMPPKKPAKVLDEITLKEGENGGHTVTHRFTSYEHKPEDHVFGASEGAKLIAHLKEHAHIKVSKGSGGGEV